MQELLNETDNSNHISAAGSHGLSLAVCTPLERSGRYTSSASVLDLHEDERGFAGRHRLTGHINQERGTHRTAMGNAAGGRKLYKTEIACHSSTPLDLYQATKRMSAAGSTDLEKKNHGSRDGRG